MKMKMKMKVNNENIHIGLFYAIRQIIFNLYVDNGNRRVSV